MIHERITAKGYVFDYIYLISLAFPDGDIWTETLCGLTSHDERAELMMNVNMPPHVTYFGMVREMTPANILTDYEWEIND